MKIKRLLRFYYSAGSLNRALDNIIIHTAIAAGGEIYGGCEAYADRISEVIDAKNKLADLWARLHSIMGAMTERDNLTLKTYASSRGGICGDGKKELHRAVVKFSRRAAGLLKGAEKEYKILCAYRCLLGFRPDNR